MNEFNELAKRLLAIGEQLQLRAEGCQAKVEVLRKLNNELRKDLGVAQ